MPPKKRNTPNGFMLFTFEWKSKYGKHTGLREATAVTGEIWSKMSAQERAPYNERAKEEKRGALGKCDILACDGTPISIVEKEKQEAENRERQMKRHIENTVRNSVKQSELELQPYFFIMVNYFTKTLKGGVYVPAEISVAEYSLQYGVSRKYHSFINPGVNIYGHHYEAKHHSETTHKLPLPPNAMGETDLGRIYNDILNFVKDAKTGEYAPVYTLRDGMSIVESVLDFLRADVSANNVPLKIYSIQYLFYILKEATSEQGELDKPKSIYITDAYFERDFFEYQSGIACQYHEENDKSKYCTQSCVTRWGFMFSDYMCADIAIALLPGRHVPQSTNIHATITPAPAWSYNDDSDSYISIKTENTSPVPESKIYDDKSFGVDDFPTLGYSSGARKKNIEAAATTSLPHKRPTKRANYNESAFSELKEDWQSNNNPWASRSHRQLPRKPDNAHFRIGDEQEISTDLDDYNSVASFGRGRSLNRSMNSTIASSAGRGRLLRKE